MSNQISLALKLCGGRTCCPEITYNKADGHYHITDDYGHKIEIEEIHLDFLAKNVDKIKKTLRK